MKNNNQSINIIDALLNSINIFLLFMYGEVLKEKYNTLKYNDLFFVSPKYIYSR